MSFLSSSQSCWVSIAHVNSRKNTKCLGGGTEGEPVRSQAKKRRHAFLLDGFSHMTERIVLVQMQQGTTPSRISSSSSSLVTPSSSLHGHAPWYIRSFNNILINKALFLDILSPLNVTSSTPCIFSPALAHYAALNVLTVLVFLKTFSKNFKCNHARPVCMYSRAT